MLKKMGIDSIGSVLNWAVTLANSMGKDVAEDVKQKMPGFLGLSLEDERIFADMRTNLSYDQDMHITDFLHSLNKFERDRFRNVVTGMPEREIVEETGKDKTFKKKITKQSNGVAFLKKIAYLVKTFGPEEARRRCLSGGVVVENSIQERALKQWQKSVGWFKRTLVMFKGYSSEAIDNLSEIEYERIYNEQVEKLKSVVENADQSLEIASRDVSTAIQRRNEETKNRSWLKKIFW